MPAAPQTEYVELHCHSAFSFLDGASSPTEIAARAAELGHSAIALTDHDGLSGSLEFAHASRALGVRPITGAEVTLEDGSHLTLLVRDQAGYANLCRLLTIAHANTRPPPDRRVLPPSLSRESLRQHTDGLVCLTGCPTHGLIPRRVAAGDGQGTQTELGSLIADFGRENVYIELQRSRSRGDRRLARDLSHLAERFGVRAVATGNVHAHHPRRAFLQDAFVAISERQTLDSSEEARRGNRDAVLRSPAEMATRHVDHPEAVAETVRLAERLEFDLTRDLGYRFPDFIGNHPGQSAQEALAALCVYQLGARYPNARHRLAARSRLDEELRLIEHHGLAGFFLMHRDLLELAREVALEVRPAGSARRWLPPGRGRGSSVGSIVCYLTGLSHVDPVSNDLFLGRFLNEDTASVPDIDLDFPRDIRERLIEEVVNRYGNEHAALVAAFPTFRIRMAIREIGGALALPPADLERLSHLADGWSSADAVEEELSRLPEGDRKLESPRWRALAFLAREASGLPRHLSQHSGGMIVSAQPLVEMVPVVPAAFPGRQICQWDKDSCQDAGFVKIDLLGLGMLSAVEECVDMIARTKNELVDLSRIGFSDQAVYDEIQDADTVGVFQIESRAQMQSILQTRPESIEDLTVQVALIRPGPVVGGAVHPYVEHRRAKRTDPNFVPPYDHPLLEDPLRETLGVVVFQEQVLEVAMALAGFSSGQAEALRRAMSRKRSREAMLALWREFLEGARARGVDDPTIESVFRKLIGFSEFGFPKAHAAAFAILAYQSAWLRRRHPTEFLAALMNAQPMGFYPPATLVRDAQRRGVIVRPPCVAKSMATCGIEDGAVRIGLGYVREVRDDAAARLVAERSDNGPFRDLADLAGRVDLREEQLVQLVRAGACDVFERPRRQMLWELGSLARPKGVGDVGRQLALPLAPTPAPALPEPGRMERALTDYETTGLSTGWHLVTLVRSGLPPETITAAELKERSHGESVCIAGLVVARQRPGTAKGILFLLLEDETGLINCIVRPDIYERHRAQIRADPLLLVWGRFERRDRNMNVLVNRLARITPPPDVPVDETIGEPDMHRVRAAAPPGQHFGRGR